MVATVLNGDVPAVAAVATRDLSADVSSSGSIRDPGYVGALLEEIREELGVKERRCVLSVGEPDAVLRFIEFPQMSSSERERAAQFEAQRYVDYAVEDGCVRLHPVDRRRNLYAIGIARRETIQTRVAAAKEGGLRPVAVDHAGLALGRALHGYDAIVDVGLERTAAYLPAANMFVSTCAGTGGASVTRSIERELTIDSRAAEKRKRIVGTAGAGEAGRAAFVADVTALLESACSGNSSVVRVALCGNGARLNNFAIDLERATGMIVETPVAPVLQRSRYPQDVLRAGALDWNLAAGLSLWGLLP